MVSGVTFNYFVKIFFGTQYYIHVYFQYAPEKSPLHYCSSIVRP